MRSPTLQTLQDPIAAFALSCPFRTLITRSIVWRSIQDAPHRPRLHSVPPRGIPSSAVALQGCTQLRVSVLGRCTPLFLLTGLSTPPVHSAHHNTSVYMPAPVGWWLHRVQGPCHVEHLSVLNAALIAYTHGARTRDRETSRAPRVARNGGSLRVTQRVADRGSTRWVRLRWGPTHPEQHPRRHHAQRTQQHYQHYQSRHCAYDPVCLSPQSGASQLRVASGSSSRGGTELWGVELVRVTNGFTNPPPQLG
jgi:hypothetical protein